MVRQLGVMLSIVVLTSVPAQGTETRRWIVDTVEELLAGRGQSVQVTPQGQLEWARGWVAGPNFDEPVILDAARAEDGSLIVGTSHPARLYRVTADTRDLLVELPAEQVTAVVVREDGEVVLATAAPGVIYRWSGGELEQAGRLDDAAIWDLTVFDGRVVAATGTPAALYRLGDRGLERWLELPDLHARCLEADGRTLLVGTSGKGLVASVDAAGRPTILVDSPFTEISDLAVGDGAVWASALVGEPAPAAKATVADDDASAEAQAVSEVTGAADLKLPKVNGKTATSEILRLTPEGGLLRVHRFGKEVAGAIAWDGEGLLVGTGWEGEVWRFLSDGGTRLATVDAVQVVGVVAGGEALLTQGPAGVLWRAPAGERAGRFRTRAKEFDHPVRFGEFRVDPQSSANRIRFRGGVTADPDSTWLEWSEWLPATSGTVPLGPSRAVQWELELAPASTGASGVERVEMAAVEVNLPPRIETLDVEEPGVVYLMSPPPSGPVIESVSPDLSGIFTVIDETEARNNSSSKGKKFYRAGYRTVSWQAADPNQDALRFALELESREGFRLPVRERITASQLGVDTSAVPDGTYRFRLTASDEAANPDRALVSERSSRWFTVDGTPPTVQLQRRDETWVVIVRDELSPVVRAEWSRDGEAWTALVPADSLLDGREERFEIPVADGSHVLVVRVMDRHHNRTTAGAVEE